MAGKNRTEKRIADERIRRAFRAGERHARAIDALAATDAAAAGDSVNAGAAEEVRLLRVQLDGVRADEAAALAGSHEARSAREALLRERNAIAEAAAGLLDEVEQNGGFYGERGERLAALLAGDAPEGGGEAGEGAPDIGNEAASARYWRAEAARLARERDEARGEAQRLSEAYGGVGEHLDPGEEAGLRDALARAQRERDEARADAAAANRLLPDAGIRNAEAGANALRAAVRRFFEAQDLPDGEPGAPGERAKAREALMQLIQR